MILCKLYFIDRFMSTLRSITSLVTNELLQGLERVCSITSMDVTVHT